MYSTIKWYFFNPNAALFAFFFLFPCCSANHARPKKKKHNRALKCPKQNQQQHEFTLVVRKGKLM